jgi:antitoxin component YwqK of YwqJK toxin-antitoxin module
MKNIVYGIILLLFIACQNNSTKKDSDTLDQKNSSISTEPLRNEYSAKIDTVNFTDANNLKQGKWIEQKGNIKLKEGNYLDNKKTGLWIEYYSENKIKNKTTFENDIPNGYSVTYDETGNISSEGTFLNGVFTQKK